MKKLLLLLLTAISALTHAGEFRNWKEHMPLIGPQQKHSSLPQQIPEQQTTKFYFTKDGRGLKKEFEKAEIEHLLSPLFFPACIPYHKGILPLSTIMGTVAIAYGIDRFAMLMHEFGHVLSAFALFPQYRCNKIYVSALPYGNGQVEHEYDHIPYKRCISLFMGPAMGVTASLGCLYAARYCDNEDIRDATVIAAASTAFFQAQNLLPLTDYDGEKIYNLLKT